MATKLLKIAAVYFVIAVLIGLGMGIAQNFSLTSVHAHLNLLGWVSLALVGLIYQAYPKAGNTPLAKAHFWLHNIGLPIMQGALIIEILADLEEIIPLVIIGAVLVIIGIVLFAVNVFRTVK